MPRRAPDALKEVIRDFRRDQIMDTARRLFGERGTTDISMDEIAAEAGVARSTVYVYFANRDDLLRACVQSMYDRLQDTIALVVDDAATPVAAAARAHPRCARTDRREPELLPPRHGDAIDHDGGRLGGRGGRPHDDRARHDPGARGSRARGIAAGDFRADLDPERSVVLVGQQIYGALSVRAGEPDPIPAGQAADEICDFVRRGLGA